MCMQATGQLSEDLAKAGSLILAAALPQTSGSWTSDSFSCLSLSYQGIMAGIIDVHHSVWIFTLVMNSSTENMSAEPVPRPLVLFLKIGKLADYLVKQKL